MRCRTQRTQHLNVPTAWRSVGIVVWGMRARRRNVSEHRFDTPLTPPASLLSDVVRLHYLRRHHLFCLFMTVRLLLCRVATAFLQYADLIHAAQLLLLRGNFLPTSRCTCCHFCIHLRTPAFCLRVNAVRAARIRLRTRAHTAFTTPPAFHIYTTPRRTGSSASAARGIRW